MIAILVCLLSFLGVSQVIFKNQTGSELRKDFALAMHIKNTQGVPTYAEDLPVPPLRKNIKWKNEEMIKRDLAYDMLNCWDDFGRGKLNVFPSERLDHQNYCYICSYIDFEEKGLAITNFTYYLMENKPAGSEITFWKDFFGRSPTASEVEYASKVSEDYINTSLRYATLFAFEKQTGFFDKKAAGLVGGGGTLGVVSLIGLAIPGVGWAATAVLAIGSGIAMAIYSVVEAPMGIPVDYHGGVILTPFSTETLLEQNCTKLGS